MKSLEEKIADIKAEILRLSGLAQAQQRILNSTTSSAQNKGTAKRLIIQGETYYISADGAAVLNVISSAGLITANGGIAVRTGAVTPAAAGSIYHVTDTDTGIAFLTGNAASLFANAVASMNWNTTGIHIPSNSLYLTQGSAGDLTQYSQLFDGTNFIANVPTGSGHRWSINGVVDFYTTVNGAGNVAVVIGTTIFTPTYQFSIHGGAGGALVHLVNTASGTTVNDGGYFGMTAANLFQIWNSEGNAVEIGTAATFSIRVASTNKTTIGNTTTAALSQLGIRGNLSVGTTYFDDLAPTDGILCEGQFLCGKLTMSALKAQIYYVDNITTGLQDILWISGGKGAASCGPGILFNHLYGVATTYDAWKAGMIGCVYSAGSYKCDMWFQTNDNVVGTITTKWIINGGGTGAINTIGAIGGLRANADNYPLMFTDGANIDVSIYHNATNFIVNCITGFFNFQVNSNLALALTATQLTVGNVTAKASDGITLQVDSTVQIGKLRNNTDVHFTQNAYYSGSWKALSAAVSVMTYFSGGSFNVSTAPVPVPNAVDGAVTWTDQFTVANSGQIYMYNLGAAGAGTALVIDANKQIIPLSSSKRYKENIQDLIYDPNFIKQIRPVSYNRIGATDIEHSFIAEDNEIINDRLINYDSEKLPCSNRQEALIAHLTMEVKRQREEIDELKARQN